MQRTGELIPTIKLQGTKRKAQAMSEETPVLKKRGHTPKVANIEPPGDIAAGAGASLPKDIKDDSSESQAVESKRIEAKIH